ncbi:hypothetical protein WDW86_07120 [Bdellovibrionota bacterium FG-2]
MAKKSKPKKAKNEIFVRYEFSDEKGRPEGGDVFRFTSMEQIQEMTAEIIDVAQSDGVAVNLTIGTEKVFYGFLKNAGMGKNDVDKELVVEEVNPFPPKKATAKKATTKKAKK